MKVYKREYLFIKSAEFNVTIIYEEQMTKYLWIFTVIRNKMKFMDLYDILNR